MSDDRKQADPDMALPAAPCSPAHPDNLKKTIRLMNRYAAEVEAERDEARRLAECYRRDWLKAMKREGVEITEPPLPWANANNDAAEGRHP